MWPGPGQWRNFPQNKKKYLHQSEFCLHLSFHCFHVHHFHFPHFHIHTLRHDWIYIANKGGAKRAINEYHVCLDSINTTAFKNCSLAKVTRLWLLQLFLSNAKIAYNRCIYHSICKHLKIARHWYHFKVYLKILFSGYSRFQKVSIRSKDFLGYFPNKLLCFYGVSHLSQFYVWLMCKCGQGVTQLTIAHITKTRTRKTQTRWSMLKITSVIIFTSAQDEIGDLCDNCPKVYNFKQLDADKVIRGLNNNNNIFYSN